MRAWLAALALLLVLLAPGAAACQLVAPMDMHARFLRWEPANGGIVAWPEMVTGFDGSCSPTLPSVAFDGARAAWIHGGLLHVADARGGVVAAQEAQGSALGWNGSLLLVALPHGRLAWLDPATGEQRPLPPSLPEGTRTASDGTRLAWIEDNATLVLVDAWSGERDTYLLPLPAEGPDRVIGHLALEGPWVAGLRGAREQHVWAFHLEEERLVDVTAAAPPGWSFWWSRGLPFLSVADGHVHMLGRVANDTSLWRATLPPRAFERWAALSPPQYGPAMPLDVQGGAVLLGAGEFRRTLAAAPWIVALAMAAGVAGILRLAARRRRG